MKSFDREKTSEPLAGVMGCARRGNTVADGREYSDVHSSLVRMKLVRVGEQLVLTPLAGGVSSRILLIESVSQRFCFKQSLAKLKVAADWYAPVERNRAEVHWMRAAAAMLSGITPQILAEDRKVEAFAMDYLEAADHPLWKTQLLAGRAEPLVAEAAGRALAAIHASSTIQPGLALGFQNGGHFRALRIEPFFLACAAKHPDLADALNTIATRTEATRLALVHGDYSPKNILLGGPQRIVVLDAECATWGDPAFDLAFCLAHLLLKFLPTGSRIAAMAAVSAMVNAYRGGQSWEPIEGFDARLTGLLPALMLARVDGKSPVDYLNRGQQEQVRRFAKRALLAPPFGSDELVENWIAETDH